MPYRDNCKAETELLTRFKIARLYFAHHMTQTAIAKSISCHRNTIGTVIRLCRAQKSSTVWKYIQEEERPLLHDITKHFGFLQWHSRTPHTHPAMLSADAEEYITKRHKDTGYGPKRLLKTLERAGNNADGVYTLAKIIGVYRRNKLSSKKIRTKNGNRRALYDYGTIAAFEYMQCDTKDVLDQTALPSHIYRLLESVPEVPKVQWTLIDAKTRTRFLAWSYHRSSFLGALFIFFVISWLRSHGIDHAMHIQFDGGSEFCSGSKRKLLLWNALFAPFGVILSQTEGVKWKQNLVERSHKPDDEEFYVPRGQYMHSKADFIVEAQRWIWYWNTERPHFGITMYGKTPKERLQELGIYQSEALTHFPVVILEDFFKPLHMLNSALHLKSAQYVLTPYLVRKIFLPL